MSEKTYLTIFRWGIYLTLLTPLLVFRSLLFPFITSKAFYFRILIEVLLVLYLFFIFQYSEYIPKRRALTIALLIFTGIFILTSFTGIDFNLSFWSDIERMEGAFGFIHLTVYFIIIVSVFRTKDEWNKLLHVFWAMSILLCLYGLGQKLGLKNLLLANDPRISSTLGNSAYLGGILLFSIALSLIFFFNAKSYFAKLMYLAVLVFNLTILLFTGTRGAYLGLSAGIAFGLLLSAFLLNKRALKTVLLASLLLFIGCGISLLLNSEKAFVKNNQYLYRLSHFSLEDATLNTRLISWKAGWKGFLDKPIFGVGSGNYAYSFDKYFPPIFYSYTSSQTYFDHAHNTLVDITATMGILGILSYLLIWAIIIFYLISNFKKGVIDLNEFVVLSGLLLAYFIQNIFVFDSLATFIAFFIFVGYIAYPQYSKFVESRGITAKGRKLNPFFACAVLIFSAFIIIKYNIIPAKAMLRSVDGQYKLARDHDLIAGFELYKKSLTYNTVLDRDIRSSFINIIISEGLLYAQDIDKEKFTEILDFSISEGEKNLALNQHDAMMNLQMGQLYNIRSRITASEFDLSRGEFYLNKAMESSPGRLQIHFILAQNRLLAGDKDKALAILQNAKKLNPLYSECDRNLLKAYAYLGDYDKLYNTLWEAVLKNNVFTKEEIYDAIGYFSEKKEYNKLEVLYERLLKEDSKNAILMARLAFIYANLEKDSQARETVMEAIKLDPGLKEEAEKFLQTLVK
ncbi:MAG: O-antigen ligase family protein [bacterium]